MQFLNLHPKWHPIHYKKYNMVYIMHNHVQAHIHLLKQFRVDNPPTGIFF